MRNLPRWFWVCTACLLLAASLPYLFALAIQPEGTLYLGVHSNFDDHAVYAAWTKQAQEGSLLFENRFTTEEQPGMTIHLYFLAAGWLAKVTGIPLALHILRVAFGFLVLLALFRFIERIADKSAHPTAFLVGTLGAGIGWLVWRDYGFQGPIDVWQPEVFVFPSLMQNGLFCAALWLILTVLSSILDAQESWSAVWKGAAALCILTNIHTYDTLLIAIVSLGLLAGMTGSKAVKGSWILRAGVIALGALPAVAWFVYVRSIDPVFAARADTVTISASMWQVALGLLPGLILAGVYLARHGSWRAVAGGGAMILALVSLQTSYQMSELWIGIGAWAVLCLFGLLLCFLYRPKDKHHGLLFAWIVMGLIAIYYPGLFQRKLAMALALPIGVCAGLFLTNLVTTERTKRLLVFAGAGVLCLTSVMWLLRESLMPVRNLSNTTMHRVYWHNDVREVLSILDKGDVVFAMPGIAVPDDFQNPRQYALVIPDLNAVVTGWGGANTYAGHWSETPDYLAKRQDLTLAYLSHDANVLQRLIDKAGATHVLAPINETLSAEVPPPAFYESFGSLVFRGDEWILVRVR